MALRGATGTALPQLSAFDDFMNGLLAKWRIPGAALAVSHNGRLAVARGYGIDEYGRPVQPDSLFGIGRISRSITAAAILRLAEQRKISPPSGPANCASEGSVKSAVLAPLGISRMRIGDTPEAAGGNWSASAADLLRFVNALDGRRPPMLLAPESLRAMIAPPAPLPAAAPCYAGLGWLIQRSGEDADWWISGDPAGGGAYLFRQASTGVDAALLFNAKPADSAAFEAELSASVARTANSITQWPAVDQFVGGPELFARDVVNGADHSGGAVAPGEFVLLFPSNAGPPEMAPWGLEGRLGAASPIGETRVFFGGEEAQVVYAMSGQMGAKVPDDVAAGKTTEVVVEYQGRRSPPVRLSVTASAPALYTLDASGKGQAAMLNETGCCNSVRNPAVRGTVASLYATGGGRIASGPRNISVTVGGVPAEVLYAGRDGWQVNFRVPANAPVGDAVPLVLRVGNRSSSPHVTMAVRSARQRILLVDDDAADRRRLARILGGAGYEVSTEAEKPPDLAIVDLALPQDANLDSIRSMRKAYPELKIVALSAQLGPDALRAADILGAQAVLTKPLHAAAVLTRVRTLLQRRPAAY
jgi:uncharacterized protein (TIGR03437 family)